LIGLGQDKTDEARSLSLRSIVSLVTPCEYRKKLIPMNPIARQENQSGIKVQRLTAPKGHMMWRSASRTTSMFKAYGRQPLLIAEDFCGKQYRAKQS
jgi:hypothetical protein